MLAAGAGGGDHPLPPGLSESLSDFLPACLCLSVSVACLSRLSRILAISRGSLAPGDIPLVSVAGSPALHRCWAQHNSTAGPLGLWNCLSPSHPMCLSVSFQPLTRCLDPHPLLGTHVPSQVTHSPPCPLKCLWPSPFTSPFSSLSSFTLKITSHLPSTLTLQNPRNHSCSHIQGSGLGVTRRWSVT